MSKIVQKASGVDFGMIKILVLVLIGATFLSCSKIEGDLIVLIALDYWTITSFGEQLPIYRVVWLLSIIAQIAIIRTYFLVGKRWFNFSIIFAPLVYLLLKMTMYSLHSIILIPFFALWIWILVASRAFSMRGSLME